MQMDECGRIILYSLQQHLPEQAVFFADRLTAAVATVSAEALELWADALLRAGEFQRVRCQLREPLTPLTSRLQYLLAVACLRLGHFAEAEAALLGDPALLELWACDRAAEEVLQHVAEGAAGLYQLGQAAEGLQKKQRALECYAKCLELCPFMWCAFERLSWLSLCVERPAQSPHEFASTVFNANLMSSALPAKAAEPEERKEHKTLAEPKELEEPEETKVQCVYRTPRKRRRSGSALSDQTSSPFSPRLPLQDTPGRWSARRAPAPLSGSSLPLSGAKPSAASSPSVPSAASAASVLSVLQRLGTAVHAFHRFRCQEALAALGTLAPGEQRSGLCQDLTARCHFELQDYEAAARIYRRTWDAGCRSGGSDGSGGSFRGLEYYSTALWHLGERLELGNLAHQVLEENRQRPEAWCVVGNCHSIEHEHDLAIKCFKRAIQLDSGLVYAYTLIGHEFVALEKYDKAVQMYQYALDMDPRHYNAWWGLGDVYQRQEDFLQAKYSFMRAAEINPMNQVLKTSLGAVLQVLNEPQRALQLLSSAAETGSALALFQKGRLLCAQSRPAEAAEVLLRARRLAPKEPCVELALGRARRAEGLPQQALRHLAAAADLAGPDRALLDQAQQELLALGFEAKDLKGLHDKEELTGPE